MNKKHFTIEEERILMSILPDFLDTLENKCKNFFTSKARADAWYKIALLHQQRSGKVRSMKSLRRKYYRIKGKLLKAVGYKLGEESACNKILQSNEVDLGNEIGGDHSGYLKISKQEVISVEEDSLLPMETKPGTVEEKDPLELPLDIATDKTTENDPLWLPRNTEQVDPLDISFEQNCSEKIYFLCNKKVDSFTKKSSLQNKEIIQKKTPNLAKDKSTQPTHKNRANTKIEWQKRRLEMEKSKNERRKKRFSIEKQRYEREKIMLRIQEERNVWEKRMLCIEVERNEREKRLLQLKEERNEQYKKILQLEKEIAKQNKIILLNKGIPQLLTE